MKTMIRALTIVGAFLVPSLAFAQSPCAALKDPAAIVACEQTRAGGAAAMHESAPNHRTVTVTVLRQAAASLNAAGIPGGPFGILVKTTGENCNGYSCDIICAGNGAAQRQWDVFGSVHEASTPGFDGPLPTIAVRPCEFVAGVPPAPGPAPAPPPAVDLSPILARLAALEQQFNALRAIVLANEDAFVREADAIREVIAALPSGIPCNQLPPYRARGWFGSVTSRPVCK